MEADRPPDGLLEADSGASGVDGAVGLSDDELVGLAREVLPGPMQAMGPSQLAKVGRAIAQRLEAGWRRDQISQVLASRELPLQVRNLVALVMARLRDDVPVDSPPPRGSDWSPPHGGAGGAISGALSWSYRLPDGRVVTARDLDCGALTVDFHAAKCAGDKRASGSKFEFAEAVGVERYLA